MWHPDELSINLVGWEHCGRYWRWDRQQMGHGGYDLWCVIDGQGIVKDGLSELEISAGDVLLYPPEPGFAARQDPEHRLIVGYIYFYVKSDRELRTWIEESPHRYTKWHVQDRAWMASLFRRCWASDQPVRGWRSSPWVPQELGITPMVSRLWLAGILNELTRLESSRLSKLQQEPVSEQFEKLEALSRRIRQRPEGRWLAEEMAEEMDLSASHFNRVFREHTGLSPRAFVIQARLDKARTLLMFSELSIGQIAEQLGYADAFCFSKQFTKEVGENPSQWRKRQG